MVYMLTFGVYKWQMLPYMAYMDPMGYRPPIFWDTIYGNPHMFQPQKMQFRSMAWPWPSRCPAPAVAFPKGS